MGLILEFKVCLFYLPHLNLYPPLSFLPPYLTPPVFFLLPFYSLSRFPSVSHLSRFHPIPQPSLSSFPFLSRSLSLFLARALSQSYLLLPPPASRYFSNRACIIHIVFSLISGLCSAKNPASIAHEEKIHSAPNKTPVIYSRSEQIFTF